MKQNTTLILWLTAVFYHFIFLRSQTLSPKRTVIITGANSGIGFAATKILVESDNWNVVMACRSKEKASIARNLLKIGNSNIEIEELDLASLKSIKAFATRWGNRPLNVLACNAGIQKSKSAIGKGSKVSEELICRTAEGFEETVGTNHIGHFYLLQLLRNNLEKTPGTSRVVIVGSGVHNPNEPGGDVGSAAGLGSMIGLQNGFQKEISMVDNSAFDPDKAYKDSKLVI